MRIRRRLALALAMTLTVIGGAAAVGAQEATDFAELGTLVDTSAIPERLLFFPLDESFEGCAPLTTACPADSSTLMLVPAKGRRLVWRPETSDLRVEALTEPAIRAVGTTPERAATIRYLVPVLDASGIELFHVARTYGQGQLIAEASDATAAAGSRESVTPVLGGPLLSTVAPSSAPERLLEAPMLIEASELDEATRVLFVRRSAPSRVVFGLRPDPGWELGVDYVPLLDDAVVAIAGLHAGVVGIAVAPPPDLDDSTLRVLAEREGEQTSSSRSWMPIAAVVTAAVVLTGALLALGRRRRSGRAT